MDARLRRDLNYQIRTSDEWAGAFAMYAARINCANRAGDQDEVDRLEALQVSLLRFLRHALMDELEVEKAQRIRLLNATRKIGA